MLRKHLTITAHFRADYWLFGVVYDAGYGSDLFDVRIGLGPLAVNIEWHGKAMLNINEGDTP